nr:isoform 2 of ankyrin-2 [Quercus suber]
MPLKVAGGRLLPLEVDKMPHSPRRLQRVTWLTCFYAATSDFSQYGFSMGSGWSHLGLRIAPTRWHTGRESGAVRAVQEPRGLKSPAQPLGVPTGWDAYRRDLSKAAQSRAKCGGRRFESWPASTSSGSLVNIAQINLWLPGIMADQNASQPRMTQLQISEAMERFGDLTDAEIKEICRSTDLPVFEPVEEGPQLTPAELDEMFRPSDPRLADARARCRKGDESVLPVLDKLAQNLTQEGKSAQDLQVCLSPAVESGNESIVHKLLSLGIPMHIFMVPIAIRQKAVNILSLFLRYGWDINKEVEWCSPPALAYALIPSVDIDEQVVSWFITNGANPDAACGIDTTPLSKAVQFAPFRIIKMLFASVPSPQNGQLLHYAAFRTLDDCGEVCRFILEHCDFGINDIMYQNHAMSYESYKVTGLGTPLHEVARCGRPETALVLLEYGADLTIPNSHGHTVLQVAETAGNEAVAQCLRHSVTARSNL